MAENQSKPPHAIVIPLPYQGVINPFVNLALKIASKGFAVTFVHLDFIHRKLSRANRGDVDFFSEAQKSGLDICCTTISDGLPLDFDRELNVYWNYMYRELPARVDEFVRNTTQADTSRVHFLVAEPLSAWAEVIAEKYKLVNVAFSTQAASVFSLAYHWDLVREKGSLPCKDDVDVEIDGIPGIESISTKDLMPYLDPEGVFAESLIPAFANVKRADFILHNTVEELEPYALSALNSYQPNYAIGPTNLFKSLPTKTVTRSFWAETDCASWLGSKPAGSVLYISLGSVFSTSKHVIDEIAYGLLSSEVNFVWVVREGIVGPSDAASSVLPVGFEDEIRDKGLIVPWCDQISVLLDPSVGGFITHCGWNSTLESMWCGVPMICYPISFDQPTVRKLVVDDWKIGIDLCDRGSSIQRKEVAEKIKSLMDGSDGAKGLRQGAAHVKQKFRNALESDGSSEKNFDRFIDELKEKICMPK